MTSKIRDGSQTPRYRLLDGLAVWVFTLSVFLFRWIPFRTLTYVSKILAIVTFIAHKKYRERVINNLSFAFGKEMGRREIRSLAKEVFRHFCLTPLETIYLAANGIPLERFILKMRVEGKEHLESALARGKGVIALGAHFGAFTLLGTRLAVEGYPVSLIIKVGRFPKLWRKLARYQRVVGQQIIPQKPISVSIKRSLNSLRRNEVLYIVADERQRAGAVSVPFLGRIAYAPPGPAIFSLKTGAAILPMFVVREDEVKRTLVIKAPLQVERTGDEKRDIEGLVYQFTKAIEEVIRQYPNQWAWLNRRWDPPHNRSGMPRHSSIPPAF